MFCNFITKYFVDTRHPAAQQQQTQKQHDKHQELQLPPMVLEESNCNSTGELSGAEIGVIRSIFIYPIKSCAGMQVQSWQITSHGTYPQRDRQINWRQAKHIVAGFLYDREWVLVDPNFAYLNQKKVDCN